MQSRLLVLGSGELGTACALSLLANGNEATMVTMLGRDKEYLHDLQHGSRAFRPFDHRVRVPSRLSFQEMGGGLLESGEASFLCVPVTSFAGKDDATSPASADPPVLQCLRQHADAPTFVFSRGLSRGGLTPCEQINHAMCSQASKLVVVSGPLFAKEWAAASAQELRSDSSNSSSNGNNGISLAFAMDDATDAAARVAVQELTERLWRRECVTWLMEPAAAGVLSLVNACVPLCSMGAGLVSSEYPSCVSAMMSYMQHAISATERLVNEVLSRPQGTPLPACAVTTLAMACTNHASREFIFGRRLNFHFRHHDAIRAVFPGNSHEPLDATVEGLHTLLQQRSLSSPFYEVLMDAFLTVLRASVVGRGLVKTGCYDYRHHLRVEDSSLLQHALAMDEAVLSGDEQRFEKTRQAVAMTFGGSTAPPPP
ncbi:hypothetical protein DQ04_00371090 [Trypanosoma grayi]|uniref:hypothetical protein n=1 Tax=Trypanosoma grayi TaxID=71804 RepID=UPI0004F3F9F4|nr:hypothetical protein DQ04_00371090 [Trypanosoma grayi]KEG14623.1 hypothetical protein DQ04_00371090 [Trypanosoma grayi]